MKRKINFEKIHNERRAFLKDHKKEDYVAIEGDNNILISAPHGVFQTRLGKKKVCEPGSLTTALYLSKKTHTYFIAKTKNNCDDANFDKKSPYKNEIKRLIKHCGVKYVLDFHGLAKKREMDINLGTDYGKNTMCNKVALDKLVGALNDNGFNVQIDIPFRGGGNTISGFSHLMGKDVFSIQIEINCGITNEYKNRKKFFCLLDVLENWIESLAKQTI